jgi:DNA-binding response OmpR family regulator
MTAQVASTSKRVLLVEDEPGLVLTLTDRLKSEGYDVQAASDGPSGLERATRERWDVILLDVMLPGASGFDVCRDLRQRGVTAPVIMLTARGQVVDRCSASSSAPTTASRSRST